MNSNLLGDGAYPLRQRFLVPYRNDGGLTAKQTTYSTKHATTRVAIERACGLLKERFQHLRYVEARRPDNIAKTTVAACVLYNACMKWQDAYEGPLFTENTKVTSREPEEDSKFGDDDDAPPASEGKSRRTAKRDYIMQTL